MLRTTVIPLFLIQLLKITAAFNITDYFPNLYEQTTPTNCNYDEFSEFCIGHKINFDQWDIKIDINIELVPYQVVHEVVTPLISMEVPIQWCVNATLKADMTFPSIDILGIEAPVTINLDNILKGYVRPLSFQGGLEYELKNHLLGYDFNHKFQFITKQVDTANYLSSDFQLISNYTDDGLITWLFNTASSSASGSNFATKHDTVIDLIMDTKSCTRNEHMFEDGKGMSLTTFKPKEKCNIQIDIVVDGMTAWQFQVIFYKRYTQLKIIRNDYEADGSDRSHTIRMANNKDDKSYDFYYRMNNGTFRNVITVPDAKRIELTKQQFHQDFAWGKTLSWKSLLHISTYNQLLDVEHFDLGPTIETFNFIIYEPYRSNLLKNIFGYSYNRFENILNFKFFSTYIATVLKNLLNELDQPSTEFNELISLLTENNDEIEGIIDEIFQDSN